MLTTYKQNIGVVTWRRKFSRLNV